MDGDGRPEAVYGQPDGFAVYRLAPDRLEPLWRLRRAGTGADAIAVGDLDGDGKPEVAVRGYHSLEIFVREGDAWRLAGKRPYPYTDVRGMDFRDLDGDGSEELVVLTGPWVRDICFRVFVYGRKSVEGGTLRPRAERPIGSPTGDPHWVPGPAASFVFGTGTSGAFARTYANSFGRLGLPNLEGLCRVTFEAGSPSAPELVWGRRREKFGDSGTSCVSFRRGGETYVLADDAGVRARRILACRRDGPWPYIPCHSPSAERPAGPAPFLLTDLDGDGDPEALLADAERVFVSGLPAAPAAAAGPADAEPLAAGPRGEAYADACLGAGAAAARGEHEVALRILRDDVAPRFPEFAEDLLRRTAETLEGARRWPDLVAALDRWRASSFLSGKEAERVAEWRAWAAAATERRETVVLDPAAPLPDLLTNAPFKFRLDRRAGSLRAFSQSYSPGFLAVPILSDESSQTLEARFRLDRLDYKSSFGFGVTSGCDRNYQNNMCNAVSRDWGRYLGLCSFGTGDLPSPNVSACSVEPSARENGQNVPDAPIRPSPEELVFTGTYVRGADLWLGELRRAGDAAAPSLALLEVRVASRNASQEALLVLSSGTPQGTSEDNLWGALELRRLSVSGAGRISTRRFVPATARDRFLRAGGRVVSGDLAGALEDYATVRAALDRAPHEPAGWWGMRAEDVRQEVDVAEALCRLGLGERDRALAALRECFASRTSATLDWLRYNHLGLCEDERTLF
ncbi:MAG: VCBS repeat-containing protein, partial [Planctomycetales bacterium]|nr:VCBS repeat-containing protein [Planctomycetales bacterium]